MKETQKVVRLNLLILLIYTILAFSMSYFIQKGYELLNYVFIMMLGIVLQPIICMGLSITHFM